MKNKKNLKCAPTSPVHVFSLIKSYDFHIMSKIRISNNSASEQLMKNNKGQTIKTLVIE